MTKSTSPSVDEVADSPWPAPKIVNPDIGNPTGIAYLDGLIHQVLDAQQDINLEANERMSQALCDVSALLDEVEAALRLAASLVSPPKAGAGEPHWITARKEALELAKGIDGGDFAGCLEPPNDLATTLAIIAAGYEFTLDVDGRLAALVAGDMGYASTDIVLEPEVMKVIGPALKPNHEARGDGVRVTDEQVQRARRAILKCRFYDPEPHMYDGEAAFFAYIATTDHWPEAEEEARDALEAALPPLGDGRAEIVEALKPFAEAADSIDDAEGDRIEMWEHPASMQVTAADFRRARAAMRSLSNPGGRE